MDLLIYTHIFLWWEQDLGRLSPHILIALLGGRNLMFVSAASIWEITTKRRIGKLSFEGAPTAALLASGFAELPITATDAEIAGGLDWDNRDPFDRILLAQCIAGNRTLITADKWLRERTEIAQIWAG